MIEDYFPLTAGGHIFLAEISAVGPALRTFLCRAYTKGAKVGELNNVAASLNAALTYVGDGVNGDFPTRFLLLRTRNAQTAVFNNAWRSHGWFEMAFPVTKALDIEDIYFLMQRNTVEMNIGKPGQHGGFQFIRIISGDVVRSVSLVNDGGRWIFTTQGQPAPFENVEQYKATRKSERFGEATIKSYFAAMGLYPFQDDFYVVDEKNPAVGIEIEIKRGPNEQDRFSRIQVAKIRENYGPF